eukprot:8915876-Lingulodinium_polyedra.AAC.1
MVESAVQFYQCDGCGGQLFQRLFPAILEDRKETATGEPGQEMQVHEHLSIEAEFEPKGTHVALRR